MNTEILLFGGLIGLIFLVKFYREIIALVKTLVIGGILIGLLYMAYQIAVTVVWPVFLGH